MQLSQTIRAAREREENSHDQKAKENPKPLHRVAADLLAFTPGAGAEVAHEVVREEGAKDQDGEDLECQSHESEVDAQLALAGG